MKSHAELGGGAASALPSSPAGRDQIPGRAPLVAFAIFATVFGGLSLMRFATFHSRSLDMAYYVRLVWGLGHGYLDQPVVNAPHVLGLHLELVLLPFALLGRLGLPIPPMLLLGQALAAAATIFPATALANRHLTPLVGRRWAFACATTILFIPTVSRCVDYDFHPSTLALFPLVAFLDAVDRRHTRDSWAWFLGALSCREDIGLQVAAVALTLTFWPRSQDERRQAAFMALFGLVWFFGYSLLIQPRFLPATGSFAVHFAKFGGGGVGGILRAATAEPWGLISHLVAGDRLIYPMLLLGQVGFVAIAAPRFLMGAFPIVGINLLSDFPGVRGIQTHYATAIAPFVIAAAILGTATIARRLPRLRTLAAGAFLAAAMGAFWLRGTSPGSPEWRWSAYRFGDEAAAYRRIVATTDPNAEVAANVRLLAHLAERRVAHMGPETGPPIIGPPQSSPE